MKRILSIFLISALVFTGCSHSNSDNKKEQTTTEQTSFSVNHSTESSTKTSEKNKDTEKDETVKITIPEGFTIYKIAKRLEANNVCSATDFISAVLKNDYSSFAQIAAMSSPSDRLYKLEGYLPPATYNFKVGGTADNAVKVFLTHGQIQGTYLDSDALTLASIIEKECGKQTEIKNVASVLHNRLNAGMRLQCDVTVKYIEAYYAEDILVSAFNGDKSRYATLYNTYKCKALPAGPICNPGAAAIDAAKNPANTDYYYFFTDKDNNYIYSKTYEEHQANMKKYGVNENTFQSK